MTNGFFRRATASTLLVVFTASSVPLALAQTDEERAGARAAADAGLKAYEAKKWSDCVDLFTRAESLVHAPPHLLYLARCSEKVGRLVKAREAYLKIKNESIAPEKPKAFHQAKTDAEKELAALEPRLPYLNVKVNGANGKTVSVTMDGVAVPPALVGIPRPVDPGEHKFQATADGMASQVETITVKEGQSDSVTLNLVAGGSVASTGTGTSGSGTKTEPTTSPTTTSATTTATTEPTTAPTSAPTTTPSADEGGGTSGLRTAGYVTLGVGIVGIGVGAFFFSQYGSKKKDADDLYDQFNCATFCTPDQQQQVTDADNKATSTRTTGLILGGVGIVALGAGITMIILGGSSSSEKKASKLTPTVQPMIGFGSFGLQGTF